MGKTLSDIAKQIGVSTATISRVINNESHITPETRQLVEEALKANNYKRRPRRKSVASKNANTVLIIAGQITNPITVAYIDGIQEALQPHEKRIFISLTDYSETTEIDYLKYARDNGFAGIFLLNVMECDELIRLLGTINVPVILVNRNLRSMDIDIVMVDNYRYGYMATQYLIQHGHKNIAHLAGPKSSITCYNRTRGYIDAMELAGLPISSSSIFYGDRHYKSGYEFGKVISAMDEKDRFTGVFCTTGLMATGMIDALCSKGIRIPEDISVICNDDPGKTISQEVEITTVENDPHVMGVAAAELFLERLKAPKKPPKRIIYPPELTERNSVRSL